MWTCKHTIPGLWMPQTRNSFYLPRKQNFLCTSTSWKERSAALSGNSSLVCAVCTFRSRQATYSRMWHCSDTEFPVGCTQFADFSFRPLAVSQTCNRLSDFLMNFPVKESCWLWDWTDTVNEPCFVVMRAIPAMPYLHFHVLIISAG